MSSIVHSCMKNIFHYFNINLWTILLFLSSINWSVGDDSYQLFKNITKVDDNKGKLLNVYTCKCEPFLTDERNSSKTIVHIKIEGRLGNRMLGYAIMLALKRKYGFRTYMEPNLLEHVNYYFPKATEISSLDRLCNDTFTWTKFVNHTRLLEDPQYRFGQALDFMPNIRMMGNTINLAAGWNVLLKEVEEEIRKTFVFRQRFYDEADKIIDEAITAYKKFLVVYKKYKPNGKKLKNVKVTIIGVHVRKRDADRDMVKYYNMPELNPSYYLSAIDLYRDKYKHALFLLVSDEMEWVYEYILTRSRTAALYPAGTGSVNRRESVGVDLALLSRCNHTITSYGTYSFWGSFLGKDHNETSRIIPSMIFNHRAHYGPIKALHESQQKKFDSWSFTDEGLVYYSDKELEAIRNPIH